MHLSKFHPDQAEEIASLFYSVFSASEDESEGSLVSQFAFELATKTPTEDAMGYIATEAENIIGCIFFSRFRFEEKPDIEAFILSPVAVHSKFQKQGVGQKLIAFGLDQLRENKVDLVLTYGDPNYYCKVGFQVISEEVFNAPLPLTYPHGWQAQSLSRNDIQPISGPTHCVTALNKQELW